MEKNDSPLNEHRENKSAMQIHIVNMHDLQVAEKEYSFMNTQIVAVHDSWTLYIEYWYRIDESWTLQCQIIRLYVISSIARSFHTAEHLQ